MGVRLLVGDGLEALVGPLAEGLARAATTADPFERLLVAVPGDAVRTWLIGRLARTLGAGDPAVGDGIVANVEFVYPGALIRRALGNPASLSPWAIGPLTWAVYDIMVTAGSVYGLEPDVLKARRIADTFDRYAVHRRDMVAQWECGIDVDAAGNPLGPNSAWQAQLWRELVLRAGPSDAATGAAGIAALAEGRIPLDLPQHVFLFGLAGLPAAHLEVLAALGRHREVHLFAPIPSAAWYPAVTGAAAGVTALPVARSADPTSSAVQHRLARGWGLAPREAHLLTARMATRLARGTAVALPPTPPTVNGLLGQLQQAIRADTDPPGVPTPGEPDMRQVLHHTDRSVQWHRCYSPGRQVEVVRDLVVHLLAEQEADGTYRYEPRDISIMCTDVALFAPLAEAAFAGDPAHGVPELPLCVADRSLLLDNPLLDAVAALVALLDGRFRASDVVAFAARGPVSLRFGFSPHSLDQLTHWVEDTHVRWGLDAHAREAFGMPGDLDAFTWRAALDRLLVGAALPDTGQRVALHGVVPYGDVEGSVVDTAGAFADLLDLLDDAGEQLRAPQPVGTYCQALTGLASALFAVPDADSWLWRALERELTALVDEAQCAGDAGERVVPATELAALLLTRLGGSPGRARFGSGAVTLSSLTAQRGVPSKVICVLGLDASMGTAGAVSSDDLIAAVPCVGDRDGRSELRAQLLDTVLSAQSVLVVCSTARDVRTNAQLAPVVVLAELLDLIDASARMHPDHAPAGTTVSTAISVEHPRQAWSDANFVADVLRPGGPWSFDTGAQAAAAARRTQSYAEATSLVGQLPPPPPSDIIDLADVLLALTDPSRLMIQRRLGVTLADDDASSPDNLIPLSLAGLDTWGLTDRLLTARLAAGASWGPEAAEQFFDIERRVGSLPPGAFGTATSTEVANMANAIVELLTTHVPDVFDVPPVSRAVDLVLPDGRRLVGSVAGIVGSTLVHATPSQPKPGVWLAMWARLATLTLIDPDVPWRAVVVGAAPGNTSTKASLHAELALRSADDAATVLVTVVDLHDRAKRSLVPAYPATAYAWSSVGAAEARKVWGDSSSFSRVESTDKWNLLARGGVDFDTLLAQPPHADELSLGWQSHDSRFVRWAERVWGTLQNTASLKVDDDS